MLNICIYIYILFFKKRKLLKIPGVVWPLIQYSYIFLQNKKFGFKKKEKRKEEFFGKYIMFLDNSLFIEMAIPRIDEIYYCKCPLTII
jgi:hypothetical protein